jgi:hypothetical protein
MGLYDGCVQWQALVLAMLNFHVLQPQCLKQEPKNQSWTCEVLQHVLEETQPGCEWSGGEYDLEGREYVLCFHPFLLVPVTLYAKEQLPQWPWLTITSSFTGQTCSFIKLKPLLPPGYLRDTVHIAQVPLQKPVLQNYLYRSATCVHKTRTKNVTRKTLKEEAYWKTQAYMEG